MFYRLRCDNRVSDWVVIELSPQILIDYECAYCVTNAGNANVYSTSISSRKTLEAFDLLFFSSDGIHNRTDVNIPLSYPTDPQAEVLVFGIISPRYIKSVSFENQVTLDKYKSLLSNRYNLLVNNNLFRPRVDYELWR